MNRVVLIGNLTRDPELTETAGGVKICRFGIAVNRNFTGPDGERKVDFFNVVAWRGLGENVARFSRKGNKVAVFGSIELRNYEDRDGVKRTAVDIVANDVEFLTPRGSSGEGEGYSPRAQDGESSSKPSRLQPFDDDGDIPF